MTPKTNIVPKNVQKLADYINRQQHPQEFARLLLTICKPRADGFTDGQKESKISVR